MKEKNGNSFFSKLKQKYRLIVMSDSTLEDRLSFRFSGVDVITVLTIGCILLFVCFLFHVTMRRYVLTRLSKDSTLVL